MMRRLLQSLFIIVTLSMCSEEGDQVIDNQKPNVILLSSEVLDATTISVEAELIDDGGRKIHSRGFCFDGISEYCIESDSQTPKFSIIIDTLKCGIDYNVTAYAENDIREIGYSQTITIKTYDSPAIRIDSIFNITNDSAYVKYTIEDDGGLDIISYGLCWNQIGSPTLSDSISDDVVSGSEFITTIGNLYDYTDYYVRAYAINTAGTSYSNTESFKTCLNIPPGTSTKFLTLISVNNSWSTYEENTWEKNFKFKENEYMQIFEICIWNTENPKVSLYMFDRNFEPTKVEFLSGGQDWVDYRESYNILNIETPAQSSQEYFEAFKLILKKIVQIHPAEHYGIKYWGHSSASSTLFGYKILDDEAEMLLSYITSIISKKLDFLDWSRNCTEGRYNRVIKEYKYADYILASDEERMGYAMAGGAVESSQMIETFFSPSITIRQSLIDMINQDRQHWEADFTKNDMITNKIKQSISIYDTEKFENMVNSTNLQSTDYTGDVLEYIEMNYPSEVQKFSDFRFHYVNNKDFFTWDKDSNGFLMD